MSQTLLRPSDARKALDDEGKLARTVCELETVAGISLGGTHQDSLVIPQ